MSTKTHLFQKAELVAVYHPSLQVRKTYLYQLDDLRTAIAHHDCNRTDNFSHLTDTALTFAIILVQDHRK